MNSLKNWIQRSLSRRGFIFLAALGLYRFISEPLAWAKADYQRLKEFPIRSIEEPQKVDLKTWRLKIEGLVDKPLFLSLDEIKGSDLGVSGCRQPDVPVGPDHRLT